MDYTFNNFDYKDITDYENIEYCDYCKRAFKYKYIGRNSNVIDHITYCPYCEKGFTTVHSDTGIESFNGVSNIFLAYLKSLET